MVVTDLAEANQMQLEIPRDFPYMITVLYAQGCAVKVMVTGIHFLMYAII